MEELHSVPIKSIDPIVETMRDENEVLAKSNFQLKFGVSRIIGGRKHQQDEYTCVDYLSKEKGPAFFAVYDGHGTDDYSAVASNTLHKLILGSALFKAGQYADAITESFLEEDKMLCELMDGRRGGTTSTVAIVIGDELYIGHLGDSRAILGVTSSDGCLHCVRITKDHNTDDPEEKNRVLSAGGIIMEGRVVGKGDAIDLTRALGDYDFKLPRNAGKADFVASKPYVPEPIAISPSCKFMVLASDGLWNQMKEEDVARTVNELWSSGMDPTKIANNLTAKLVEGFDNVTVIVVFFIRDKIGTLDDTDEPKILVSEHESKIET